jgi:hypothetical protein
MLAYSRVYGRNNLVLRGPVIRVSVGIPERWARELRKRGLAVPVPVNGEALIDTGSTVTAIDHMVIRSLGLPAVRSDLITTPTGTSRQAAYPA